MNGAQDPVVRGPAHERAREITSAAQDGFATAEELAWLDAHLAVCEACTAFAAEMAGQSSLFAPGRAAMPEAPRDLWARTAAAIEAERRPARGPSRRRRGFAGWAFVPLAGAMVVVVAVGIGLLNGLPAPDGSPDGDRPDATPIALSAGNVTVLVRGDDGNLELRRQVVDEVCPLEADGCGLVPSPEVTKTDLLVTDDGDSWAAFISPASDEVVVMDRDGTGIFVLPLQDSGPAPTKAPATEPPATAPPSLAATSEPTALPAESPATTPEASAPASVSPDQTPAVTEQPTADATDGPTEPPTDPAPTPGTDATPESTSEPTPEPSPEPTASIAVTPRPDGAIEILSDVVLVGTSAAYSPDGSHFAFTARRADGSAGPDVYVWRVGDDRAMAVTEDHASQFSGWLGTELLVSRVQGTEGRTVVLSLEDGSERPAHDGPMWLPAVGPGEGAGVWWEGSLAPDADGLAWVPETGSLVLEPWPAGEGGKQVLAEDIADWQAAWDPDGRLLAVWTSTGDPGDPGTLSLYAVDPETGRADLEAPKLAAEPAFEGFSIGEGRLMWSAPDDAGDSTVQVLAWDGDTFGRLEILATGGTKVVR